MRDDLLQEPGDEGSTLTEVIGAYSARGFTTSFEVTPEARLRCGSCSQTSDAAAFTIESMRRMEGASDPADMLAVVALTCPSCSSPGTVALGYGPMASSEDSDVLRALRDERSESDLPGHSAPGEAFGEG